MAVHAALPSQEQVLLAARLQRLFRDRGLSLTDPRTAEVFQASMASTRLLLGAALKQGVLDPAAFATLVDFVDAAEDVPNVL